MTTAGEKMGRSEAGSEGGEAPTPAPTSAPAPGPLAWARSHQNQLVIAGLVLICLILDAIAFRNVQAYEQASGHSLLGLFCVIFIPFTFATPALYYLIFIRRARHELVFVLAGALIGLMLMFVRTPYTWFDENDHA
ncbi:MAG: hypothetical protein LBO07_04820, partial [Coriobacteriales bacterium]|nr:hypothetical protein [Coriobacteriales bacterium]